jgi:tripeptidyl-peptidase-1
MRGRSDPNSPRYGKYLSVEEVHDLFAPSQETVDQVRTWLESEGISADRISQSVNKQWLQFSASAPEVEKLLRTEYFLYEHAGTGKSHIACREYVLALPLSDNMLIKQVPCPSISATAYRLHHPWHQATRGGRC